MEYNTVKKHMVVLPLAEMIWNQHCPGIMNGWQTNCLTVYLALWLTT